MNSGGISGGISGAVFRGIPGGVSGGVFGPHFGPRFAPSQTPDFPTPFYLYLNKTKDYSPAEDNVAVDVVSTDTVRE